MSVSNKNFGWSLPSVKNFKVPANITTTVKIYLAALPVFSLFRLILFFSESKRLDNQINFEDIFYAFFMGIRFDLVICGYIMLIPFLLLTIRELNVKPKWLNRICFYYVIFFFLISFLVCAADIPYFKQFFSRFSVAAFEWADSPVFVINMILEEPSYWLYIIPFFILSILFRRMVKKSMVLSENNYFQYNKLYYFLFSALAMAMIFLGIRGRLDQKSPIRIGTAYFCNNAFLNQLGLNPNFTLLRSSLDKMSEENKPITLMDNEKALQFIQREMNIAVVDSVYPILRKENDNIKEVPDKNIVLVMMESMSAAKMKRHGNKDNLTPFLDSISQCGYYFENAYSAGIHTYNGIFSSLFSFPAIFQQHPLKESSMPKYHGMASALKKQNYSTVFFTTHDGQFDNMEGFLMQNDFERVISKKDYPSEKIKTTLGVPDDYLFEYSIPVLNELHRKGKPFFSAFITSSDHGPYYIPEYFKSTEQDIKKQSVQYADYSLKKFIAIASGQPWFKNTLFVFVADHGAPLRTDYDIALDYVHVPLLFYSPELIPQPKTFTNMAGQIDLFPSVMGLLGIPFENNTLGINLFKQKRPYIFFNADDKYGVIDSSWLLIVKKDKSMGLYKYLERDMKNYSSTLKPKTDSMKNYAESYLQTFQYLISKKKV